MKTLEHYNPGMKFALNRQSGKSNYALFKRQWQNRNEVFEGQDNNQALKELPSAWLHCLCTWTTQHHSSQRWGVYNASGRGEVTE